MAVVILLVMWFLIILSIREIYSMKLVQSIVRAGIVAASIESAFAGASDAQAVEPIINKGFQRACYEPVDTSPEKIERLKQRNWAVCAPRCFDEGESQHKIDALKERGGRKCVYQLS